MRLIVLILCFSQVSFAVRKIYVPTVRFKASHDNDRLVKDVIHLDFNTLTPNITQTIKVRITYGFISCLKIVSGIGTTVSSNFSASSPWVSFTLDTSTPREDFYLGGVCVNLTTGFQPVVWQGPPDYFFTGPSDWLTKRATGGSPEGAVSLIGNTLIASFEIEVSPDTGAVTGSFYQWKETDYGGSSRNGDSTALFPINGGKPF